MKTFLIILIFLISFSSVAYSQQYYTISPGRGIDGVINLGVDMVRVFERWGVSDTVNEGYGVLVYDYYKYQLSFATDIYTNKVAIIYIYILIYTKQILTLVSVLLLTRYFLFTEVDTDSSSKRLWAVMPFFMTPGV